MKAELPLRLKALGRTLLLCRKYCWPYRYLISFMSGAAGVALVDKEEIVGGSALQDIMLNTDG